MGREGRACRRRLVRPALRLPARRHARRRRHRGRVPRLAHPLQRRAARGDASAPRRDGARSGPFEHRRAALARRARLPGALAGPVAAAASLRRGQPAVQRRLAARAAVPLGAAPAPGVHGAQRRAARLRRPAPRADRADRPARADARLRQPVLARRLPRPLRRVVSRQVAAAADRPDAGRAGTAAGAVPAGAAARGAGLLEHGQAVQGRRAVRRAGALRAPARRRPRPRDPRRLGAGAGPVEGGACRPRRAHRGRLPGRAAPAAPARAQRRLPPALSRGDPVGRAVLAPAPRSRLPLQRRRRPRRLPAPLRPRGAAAAGRSADAVVDALERLRRDPGRSPPPCSAPRTPPPGPGPHAGIAAVYAGQGWPWRGRCHNRAAPPGPLRAGREPRRSAFGPSRNPNRR